MAGAGIQAASQGKVLKIGVTGARILANAQIDPLRTRIDETLRHILALGARHGLRAGDIQLLSPLADGADRMLAASALAAGMCLVCVLPFAQEAYEATFLADAGSIPEFRALLARAEGRVLQLDGDPVGQPAGSFEALGRMIARNADLMIGIWDGATDNGRGGTAATLRFAAQYGPPILWLNTREEGLFWVDRPRDFVEPRPCGQTIGMLEAYLDRLLVAPAGTPVTLDSMLHRIGHSTRRLHRRRPQNAHMLVEFANEGELPERWIWTVHARLMRWLAKGAGAPSTPRHEPHAATAAAWFARYESADRLARAYAARYRSSYVIALFLGIVTVMLAEIGLTFSAIAWLKLPLAVGEFASLLLIALMVANEGARHWQRKAIEYRLVAELCRKQQNLGLFAWAVPGARSWAAEPVPDADEGQAPASGESLWVSGLFSAWERETPLRYGVLDAATVATDRKAALADLIDDQIAYHMTRHNQNHRAGKRLARIGEMLFGATVLLVLVKCLVFGFAEEAGVPALVEVGLEFLPAILPALAGALVGLRSYAEMEMLAEQSAHMLRILRRARARTEEIDPAAPLASQAIGAELAAVATVMLEDLDGWAKLFRAKVVEA